MATIANAAIMFTANASGITAGLKSVGGQVQSLGATFTTMGGVAAKAFAFLAPILGVAGFAHMTSSAAEAIDRLDELSIKTGVSTEALSRLGYAAQFSGLDIETVATSINKMQKALSGNEKQANLFSSLGLDIKRLKAEKPDVAFGEIADAINSLASPTDRAMAAMQIFGKEGANLLPFLAEGSEGLRKLGEESDAFGKTVKDTDAIQVAKMVDGFGKIKSAFEGAMNTIVIQAAPMITALLDKITDWLSHGTTVVDSMVTSFETLLECIATGADYMALLDSAITYSQAVFSASISVWLKGISKIANAINKLTEGQWGFGWAHIDTEGIDTWATAFEEAAKQAAGEGEQAWNEFANGENAAKVRAFFDDIRNGASKAAQAEANARTQGKGMVADLDELMEQTGKINDIFDKLNTSITEFGLTDNEKLMLQLKGLGATEKQIGEAKFLMGQLDELNKNKTLDEEAKKVLEDIQTPFEKAQNEIAKLDELLSAGKLSWEEYQKAVDKVNGELDKPHDIAAPDFYETGSQQAKRLSLDLARGIEAGNPQVAEQKKSNNWLEKIYRNTRDIASPAPLALAEV
jgi:hypothetical protein